MNAYETQAATECRLWQQKMLKRPGVINILAKKLQEKINSYIPEKIHEAITYTIRQMIRTVLFGAEKITSKPLTGKSLEERETLVLQKIKNYKRTGAAEGAITGAGGILLGLADFPLLLGIKLKLLFDIASLYGFDVRDYKERVYLLHIFELAFSGDRHRKNIFLRIKDWNNTASELPEDITAFDWRNFQQEYRDYIDIPKMAQLIPVIGAPVGFVINYRLIKKLGYTAMNAYRMRLSTEAMLLLQKQQDINL